MGVTLNFVRVYIHNEFVETIELDYRRAYDMRV